MLRFLAPLALLLPLTAGAQPLPRVGAEIDGAEQAYFGFFNDLPDVIRATVEEATDGGVRFRIERASGDIGIRTMTAAQRRTLEAYLTRYEDQAAVEALDFRDLTRIVSYRAWYTDGERVEVERLDGERIEGRLLHIEPDRLLIWPGADPYAWDRAAAQVRVLRFDEIATVRSSVSRAEARIGGVGAALLVGGANLALGAGAYFLADAQPVQGAPVLANTVLSTALVLGLSGGGARGVERVFGREEVAARLASDLRERTAFPRRVAPELLRLPLPEPDPGQPSVAVLRARAAAPAVMVSVGGTYLLGREEPITGFYADGSRRVPVETVRKPPAAWYADLSVGLGRRFRLGTNVLFAPRAPGEAWVGYSHGTTATAYVEGVVKPHDPLFLDPSGRWSVAVAAGASQSWVSTGIELDFPPQIVSLDPSLEGLTDRTASRSALGAFGRVTVGYHLSNSVSLAAALSYRSRSSVTVEAEERAYQSGSASGLLYQWEAFSGTFPTFDVFVGTRLHF